MDVTEQRAIEQMKDVFVALAQLTDALASADAAALAEAAHALKGGAAYLGAELLRQQCLELETRGRSGVTAGSDILGQSLLAEFDRTRAALMAELARQDADTAPAAA